MSFRLYDLFSTLHGFKVFFFIVSPLMIFGANAG